jgi:HAD superfamily hydrolase (TIGR01509 family)
MNRGTGFFDTWEAVIFDLDGTLADSMGLWGRVCADWLTGRGKRPEQNLEGVLSAMSLSQAADYVIKNYQPDLLPAEVIGQWGDMVLDEYRQRVPLKPGAGDLVRSLALRGKKLAIATSCFPAACEALLARCRIRKYFSALVYTDEIRDDSGRTLNKTFPHIWRAAAVRLGTPPEKCFVFEDLYAALKGVRAAGMGIAAVWDASCEDWPAFSAGADLALHSPQDALALLAPCPELDPELEV